MKIMSYKDYELYSIEHKKMFFEQFDEFIDIENTGDLYFQLDINDDLSIAARNEDADVVVVWLPNYREYIFYETSISEVLECLCIFYPESEEKIRDSFAHKNGEIRIHSIIFNPSAWEVSTSSGRYSFSFDPSDYIDKNDAYEDWIDWCEHHLIDKASVEKFENEVKKVINCHNNTL